MGVLSKEESITIARVQRRLAQRKFMIAAAGTSVIVYAVRLPYSVRLWSELF